MEQSNSKTLKKRNLRKVSTFNYITSIFDMASFPINIGKLE